MCRARVDHAAGFKIATGEPQIKLSPIDGALSPHPAAPSSRSSLLFIAFAVLHV